MFIAGETETVVRLRRPKRDSLGDRVGPVPEVDITGCLFAPGSSSEFTDAANQVDVDGTVYMPAGSPQVLADDQLRIRGDVHEVVGKPAEWSEGTVIHVHRVTG